MAVLEQGRAFCMRENVSELAVLPHVVFSILEPIGPQEPSAAELFRMISADPGFATKALVLANSFVSQGTASLQEAVEVLGYRTVRTLAMTAGTFEMFVGKNDPCSLRRRRWWRHSVDAAQACHWLAATSGRTSAAEAYTVGLLHLVGKSLLDRYGNHDYTLITERQASGERDWQAERTVYGCDHIELLVSLCEQWRLPVRMIEAFNYNEEPAHLSHDMPLRACLAIGTRLASASCKGPELGSGDLADCPDWALGSLGFTRERFRTVLDGGIGALA